MADLNFSVNDNLGVDEALSNAPSDLHINVLNDVLVEDYGDIWDFIQVYDDIGHQDILLDISIPEIPLLVFDEILADEYAEWNRENELNVFDFVTIDDFANQTWGLRLIDLYDTAWVVDYAEGTLIPNVFGDDVSTVFDFVELTVGIARSGFSNIYVAEFLNIAREILYNEIAELVSVVEYAILGREVEMLNAQDDLAVFEVAIAEITLDLTFNDFLRSYPFDEETLTNIIIEQFESGAEQRRDKWGRTRKRFGVNFNPRSKEEIDALMSFYLARRGPANAFDFISPLDGVDYMVRFEDNSLRISRTAFGIYQASVTLIEVFR